jgi:1-acyl-sn-glycerol-3-phosphate acyltransferase
MIPGGTQPRARPFALTLLIFSMGYASYWLSKAVLVICALPLLVVLRPFPRARDGVLHALVHRYLGFFTRTWLPLLGLYRVVEISGLGRALSVRPVIYVANHRGFMDSILLLGLLPRTGVLIKARDTKPPSYALLARHFDLVSVDRGSLESLAASLEKCRRLLAAGKNLLVFPEGTRARSGRLHRFNAVAFELAQAAGVPVLPVIVHSTTPFMAKLPGSLFPRERNQYRIRFLAPEPPRAGEEAEALNDRVRRHMIQELKPLDAGTCWEVK